MTYLSHKSVIRSGLHNNFFCFFFLEFWLSKYSQYLLIATKGYRHELNKLKSKYAAVRVQKIIIQTAAVTSITPATENVTLTAVNVTIPTTTNTHSNQTCQTNNHCPRTATSDKMKQFSYQKLNLILNLVNSFLIIISLVYGLFRFVSGRKRHRNSINANANDIELQTITQQPQIQHQPSLHDDNSFNTSSSLHPLMPSLPPPPPAPPLAPLPPSAGRILGSQGHKRRNVSPQTPLSEADSAIAGDLGHGGMSLATPQSAIVQQPHTTSPPVPNAPPNTPFYTQDL